MIGNYLGGLYEAWRVSGIFGWLLVAVWCLWPTAFVTVWHPSDAVGFQLWLQGFVVPNFLSGRALYAGEAAALLFLAMLSLAQYNILQMIYRRCGFFVQMAPLAFILLGLIGNGIWYWRTGVFDLEGCLVGLLPMVGTIISHGICEHGAGEFVFGPGEKPHYQGGY
jgi:hypothetical protein